MNVSHQNSKQHDAVEVGQFTAHAWQRVMEILGQALELTPDAVPEYLSRSCAGNTVLQHQVESLLAEREHLLNILDKTAGAADLLLPALLKGNPLSDLGTDQAPDLGRRVGAYRLRRCLGHGGMGAVYLGERIDGAYTKEVAIKILRRGMENPEAMRRFLAERRILARLEHPNVARLLDAGTTTGGRPYFVMERIHGQPLDVYCEAHELGVRARVELLLGVCEAVRLAHRNLIVHRDLKPANILVTEEGQARLLDFGIAKLLEPIPEVVGDLTDGIGPMTPLYASPEQITGEPISPASDVYSLGVVLYQLLTGRLPYRFVSKRPDEMVRMICNVDPAPPSVEASDPRRRSELAGDLDCIILKALRKEPERRFASAEELAEDLHRYLEGLPLRSRPGAISYHVGKFLRRHAWRFAMVAILLGLGLGSAMFIAAQQAELTRQRDRAEAMHKALGEILAQVALEDPATTEHRRAESVDRLVQHMGTALAHEPFLYAPLLDIAGHASNRLGNHVQARRLLTQALEHGRKAWGNYDPELAMTLYGLANAERQLGNEEHADALLREAFEILRPGPPSSHVDKSYLLVNVGHLAIALSANTSSWFDTAARRR